MYSRVSIQTRLSPTEAEEILHRLVKPKLSFLEPDPTSPDDRPFEGRVDAGTFRFSRVIRGRNSFLPVITGRIVQGKKGAIAVMTMRLAYAVALVLVCFVGFTAVGAFRIVTGGVQYPSAAGGVIPVMLPVFGVVLLAAGYYPEKRKAERILRDALSPQEAVR